eukprot:365910-Chlamydomonas_euryale.AAC.23
MHPPASQHGIPSWKQASGLPLAQKSPRCIGVEALYIVQGNQVDSPEGKGGSYQRRQRGVHLGTSGKLGYTLQTTSCIKASSCCRERGGPRQGT